jgi:hypothetical protein
MRLFELWDRLFGHVPSVAEREARASMLAVLDYESWRTEAATLPRGVWTPEDYGQCVTGFSGDVPMQVDAVRAAMAAGHMRDLGIGAARDVRRCGLHGAACGVLASGS